MKKKLKILLRLLLPVFLLVSLSFINGVQEDAKCKDIVISVHSDDNHEFINEGDVLDLINNQFNTPVSQTIGDIHTDLIEDELENHHAVENAEVHITVDGRLLVDIEQRRPIARIFPENGRGYYLDENGGIMPLSNNYTARVLVVNGMIKDEYTHVKNYRFDESVKNDSLFEISFLDELFEVCKFMDSNPFWNAQIEQLYVNKDSDIELIPRVGNHTIVLGEPDLLTKKFDKLMIFYRQGLTKTGWNEYEKINLKFKDQIVCTKRNYYGKR